MEELEKLERYEKPEMEIIDVENDVITASCPENECDIDLPEECIESDE